MPSIETREQKILRALKRCSEETIAAALRFQSTPNDADMATVICGVLRRDLPEDHATALDAATDESRLIEDLGMDSFGMFEIVMTAEETFGIRVENQEMKDIATIGQLKAFVQAKLGARSAAGAAGSPAP